MQTPRPSSPYARHWLNKSLLCVKHAIYGKSTFSIYPVYSFSNNSVLGLSSCLCFLITRSNDAVNMRSSSLSFVVCTCDNQMVLLCIIFINVSTEDVYKRQEILLWSFFLPKTTERKECCCGRSFHRKDGREPVKRTGGRCRDSQVISRFPGLWGQA